MCFATSPFFYRADASCHAFVLFNLHRERFQHRAMCNKVRQDKRDRQRRSQMDLRHANTRDFSDTNSSFFFGRPPFALFSQRNPDRQTFNISPSKYYPTLSEHQVAASALHSARRCAFYFAHSRTTNHSITIDMCACVADVGRRGIILPGGARPRSAPAKSSRARSASRPLALPAPAPAEEEYFVA